jgi:N-acetylmuramoyl-L-alanine amidase
MESMPSSPRSSSPHPKRNRPVRVLQTTLGVAILLATLFTAWTPAGLFSGGFSQKLSLILTAQPENQAAVATNLPQLRIGIVAGHWGNDSGAVCTDGAGRVTLTEQEVNFKIATLVQQRLVADGYQVDLLQEFDPRLNGYRAAALVSIHNDSCDFIDNQATGFKVAAALTTHDVNRASRLTECLRDRFQRATGLAYHAGSITADMREYHAFAEIDPDTIAAIIETGFLNLDRDILVNHTDRVADGVAQGILCFINNENIEPATPTALP